MSKFRRVLSYLKRWFLLSKKRANYKVKITKIYNKTKKLTSNIELDIKNYKRRWINLDNCINPLWYETYSLISGVRSQDYVPEDLYYGIIEPLLNNNNFATAYADKNFYNKYYSEKNIFPETLLRNIHGLFYDKNYEYIKNLDQFEKCFNSESKLIIKPSIDSWGGKMVEVFYKKSGHYYTKMGQQLTIEYLVRNYKQDFVIQKYIESANYFKELNPTSLNTVRMYTYRSVKTNKIAVYNSIVRIGSKDAEVDNVSSGGVCCLVSDDGKLSDYALDIAGNKVYSLPSNENIKFSDIKNIPKYDEIKKLAEKLALKNNYQRLLGFDFCIDNKNKVRVIEINNRRIDINCFQFFGLPLFREYTDEIIEYCNKKKQEDYKYIL